MRRRPKARRLRETIPPELREDRWPMCPRWDGGEQRCGCWFSEQQRAWVDAGNEWPGGEAQYFADFLRAIWYNECHKPFDQSAI